MPFPSPGDLPNPGIEPKFPAFQANSLPSEPPGNPTFTGRRHTGTETGRLWFRLGKASVSFLDSVQVRGAIRQKEITAPSSPHYCLQFWVSAAFPVIGEKQVKFHRNQFLLRKIIHLNSRVRPLAMECGSDILYQGRRPWT